MKFWKVLAGLGVAAAAAGVAVALTKKKDDEDAILAEEYDFENGLDEILDEEDIVCEECDCNCDECDCDCDFEDCEFFDEADDKGLEIKDAVNSVIDGVMGGIVIAADKVSELCGKLADVVSDKLVKCQEAALWDDEDDLEWDLDFDDEDEACDECCDCAECAEDAAQDAAEVVIEVVEDVSEAIHEATETEE